MAVYGVDTLDPAAALEELARARYVSLTTFRRDGTAVSTPVWAAAERSALLVWTAAASWKVKRLRHDPHVLVAACDVRGRELSRRFAAVATVRDETETVLRLLRGKYGWQLPALRGWNRVRGALSRRPAGTSVTVELEIQPARAELGRAERGLTPAA